MINQKIGIVVSNKAQKTIIVLCEKIYSHKKYGKILIKKTRLMAHDELNECKIGDIVIIIQSRPLSRHKNWILSKILTKNN